MDGVNEPVENGKISNLLDPYAETQTIGRKGVLVFLAAKSGHIKNAEEAAEFQNFIICVEMLIAAVGHLYAFPYKEYAGANIGAVPRLRG
ncbi:putative organic solute transporter subunit alpha/Transmembrane protein [Helianthus annuus]|nr:putative organic solute transporter subunit alpha/Transmembrane protein [Helianthus annuus]